MNSSVITQIVFFELIFFGKSDALLIPEIRNTCHQSHCNGQKIFLLFESYPGPTVTFQPLHYMNSTSFIGDPTVHFSARTCRLHCICNLASATAASSYGWCAFLCSWWLDRWSLSGHPEPHPAAPAPSQPPGQGSLAASAFV